MKIAIKKSLNVRRRGNVTRILRPGRELRVLPWRGGYITTKLEFIPATHAERKK